MKDDNKKEKILILLKETLFSKYYLTEFVCKYQRRDRCLSILIAIGTSSSIATWTLWQDKFSPIWGFIVIIAQVAVLVKSQLPYARYIERMNEKYQNYNMLSVDVEKLWYEYENGQIAEDVAESTFWELKRRCTMLNHFENDVVFKPCNKVIKKAREHVDTYMTRYE